MDDVKLFEMDGDGELMLTEVGERLMESVGKRVRKEISALTDSIDEYFAYAIDEIRRELAEDGAEIAQLMVALTTAKTAEERRAVLLKLSAAARAAAVSPAEGSDWGDEAPNSSDVNKASITPGRSFQREQDEKQMRQAIFNEVAGFLNESQAAALLEYTQEFDVNAYDPRGFKDSLEEAKEILFPGASPMSRYCAAVSRHVRKV